MVSQGFCYIRVRVVSDILHSPSDRVCISVQHDDKFLVCLHGEYQSKYVDFVIRKLGSVRSDEDSRLRIESFAMINSRT